MCAVEGASLCTLLEVVPAHALVRCRSMRSVEHVIPELGRDPFQPTYWTPVFFFKKWFSLVSKRTG